MTRDQILAQLLKGPQTVEELQKVLGYTYDKTHNSLARLVKGKRVFRLADKRYAHASQVALVNNQPQVLATTPKKTLVFGSLDKPTVIDTSITVKNPATQCSIILSAISYCSSLRFSSFFSEYLT